MDKAGTCKKAAQVKKTSKRRREREKKLDQIITMMRINRNVFHQCPMNPWGLFVIAMKESIKQRQVH